MSSKIKIGLRGLKSPPKSIDKVCFKLLNNVDILNIFTIWSLSQVALQYGYFGIFELYFHNMDIVTFYSCFTIWIFLDILVIWSLPKQLNNMDLFGSFSYLVTLPSCYTISIFLDLLVILSLSQVASQHGYFWPQVAIQLIRVLLDL